jgi:hypothetical protein
MSILKIEIKYCYIWTSHGEKCSDFILVNIGLHNFKHRHAKHVLGFWNSILTFKIN